MKFAQIAHFKTFISKRLPPLTIHPLLCGSVVEPMCCWCWQVDHKQVEILRPA